MKDNSFDDIKKAVDNLLKINSTVKRKKKAYIDKQKDLFTNILMALQALQTRTILTQAELKVDFSTKSFNYYNFDGVFNNWNKKAKEFLINGYKLLINIKFNL